MSLPAQTFMPDIVEWLKRQGAFLALLCIVSYYFYLRTEELEAKSDACMHELNTKMLEAVNNNTRALERIEFRLGGQPVFDGSK